MTPQSPQPEADAAAAVNDAAAAAGNADDPRDVHCIRCGYHLFGIDDRGRCPECGLPLYWTTRAPQQLAQYPAAWVATMAWAVRLLLLAYFVPAVVLLIEVTRVLDVDGWLVPIALVGAGAAQLGGMWMLARPSRHWSEPAQPLVRFLLYASPVGPMVAAAATGMIFLSYRPALESVAMAGLAAGALGPTAAFLRLRAVARMIADAGLAEHSAIVGWGFLVTLLYVSAIVVMDQWSIWRPRGDAHLLVLLAGLTGLLLFLLWGAVLMLSCAVDFGRAAKVAADSWRADAPSAD